MYANILLSTDGSDVARKGVERGLLCRRRTNAKAIVITVTEPLPIDHGSGHASGWDTPPQREVDHFEAASKEHADKVLGEGSNLWRSGSEYLWSSGIYRMRTQPLRLSKQQSPKAAI